MDRVDLPIIEPGASLANAIKLMKDKRRSAVLVAHGSKPKVIDVDIILHTFRTKGNLSIGKVVPRDVTIALKAGFSADKVLANREARGTVQALMDNARAIYALAGTSRGRAVVLTRHEGFKDMVYSSTRMWRCKANSDHIWTTADLWQPGNKCREDQSDTELV